MRPMLDSLPLLYRDLLPEFFQKGVPVETKATCDACAMCPSSAAGTVESVDGVSRLFRPDTKCCTYYPRLPNFLVGALLSDERPELAEGRRALQPALPQLAPVLRPGPVHALPLLRGAAGRLHHLALPRGGVLHVLLQVRGGRGRAEVLYDAQDVPDAHGDPALALRRAPTAA